MSCDFYALVTINPISSSLPLNVISLSFVIFVLFFFSSYNWSISQNKAEESAFLFILMLYDLGAGVHTFLFVFVNFLYFSYLCSRSDATLSRSQRQAHENSLRVLDIHYCNPQSQPFIFLFTLLF